MPKFINNLVVTITQQYKSQQISLDQAETYLKTVSEDFGIPMFAIVSVIQTV